MFNEHEKKFENGNLIGLDRIHRVLVVGAGVAGLQATRALLRSGFAVVVLEEEDRVGGVWSRNHAGYALQVPWYVYQFPDYPYPPKLRPANEYPTGPEVHAYVESYAHTFDLHRHIRFNSRLTQLVQMPGANHGDAPMWVAQYTDRTSGQEYELAANFVVLSTGLFSTPFIPSFTGLDRFEGLAIHSKEAASVDFARDKQVVVVGAGRTGWDLVSEIGASQVAKSVTILYRHPHWTLPRELDAKEDVVSFLYTRRTLAILPPYYKEGPATRMRHALLRPLKSVFWGRVTKVTRQKSTVAKLPLPDAPLESDLFNGGQIYDPAWCTFMRDPCVRLLQGTVRSVGPRSVEMEDGASLPCDVLLFCTGYFNTYKFLSHEVRQALDVQPDGLYLYRNVLPPGVSNLAFVGAEVSTFNNLLTSGLQAEWLARAMTGHVKLPSRAEMVSDLGELRGWRRRTMPPARNRASVYMLYQQAYHDQLLQDMGESTHRKPWHSPLSECFSPYMPEDYADIVAPRLFSSFTAIGGSCRRHAGSRTTSAMGKGTAALEPTIMVSPPSGSVHLVPDGAAAGQAGTCNATDVQLTVPTPQLVLLPGNSGDEAAGRAPPAPSMPAAVLDELESSSSGIEREPDGEGSSSSDSLEAPAPAAPVTGASGAAAGSAATTAAGPSVRSGLTAARSVQVGAARKSFECSSAVETHLLDGPVRRPSVSSPRGKPPHAGVLGRTGSGTGGGTARSLVDEVITLRDLKALVPRVGRMGDVEARHALGIDLSSCQMDLSMASIVTATTSSFQTDGVANESQAGMGSASTLRQITGSSLKQGSTGGGAPVILGHGHGSRDGVHLAHPSPFGAASRALSCGPRGLGEGVEGEEGAEDPAALSRQQPAPQPPIWRAAAALPPPAAGSARVPAGAGASAAVAVAAAAANAAGPAGARGTVVARLQQMQGASGSRQQLMDMEGEQEDNSPLMFGGLGQLVDAGSPNPSSGESTPADAGSTTPVMRHSSDWPQSAAARQAGAGGGDRMGPQRRSADSPHGPPGQYSRRNGHMGSTMGGIQEGVPLYMPPALPGQIPRPDAARSSSSSLHASLDARELEQLKMRGGLGVLMRDGSPDVLQEGGAGSGHDKDDTTVSHHTYTSTQIVTIGSHLNVRNTLNSNSDNINSISPADLERPQSLNSSSMPLQSESENASAAAAEGPEMQAARAEDLGCAGHGGLHERAARSPRASTTIGSVVPVVAGSEQHRHARSVSDGGSRSGNSNALPAIVAAHGAPSPEEVAAGAAGTLAQPKPGAGSGSGPASSLFPSAAAARLRGWLPAAMADLLAHSPQQLFSGPGGTHAVDITQVLEDAAEDVGASTSSCHARHSGTRSSSGQGDPPTFRNMCPSAAAASQAAAAQAAACKEQHQVQGTDQGQDPAAAAAANGGGATGADAGGSIQALATAMASEGTGSGSLFTFTTSMPGHAPAPHSPIQMGTPEPGPQRAQSTTPAPVLTPAPGISRSVSQPPLQQAAGMYAADVCGDGTCDSSASNLLRRLSGRVVSCMPSRSGSVACMRSGDQAAPVARPHHLRARSSADNYGTGSCSSSRDIFGGEVFTPNAPVRPSMPSHAGSTAHPQQAVQNRRAYDELIAALLSASSNVAGDGGQAEGSSLYGEGREESARLLSRLSGRVAPSVTVSGSHAIVRTASAASSDPGEVLCMSGGPHATDVLRTQQGACMAGGAASGTAGSTSQAVGSLLPVTGDAAVHMYLQLLSDLGVLPDRLSAVLGGSTPVTPRGSVQPGPSGFQLNSQDLTPSGEPSLMLHELGVGAAGAGASGRHGSHSPLQRLSGRVVPSGSCAAVTSALLEAEGGAEVVADVEQMRGEGAASGAAGSGAAGGKTGNGRRRQSSEGVQDLQPAAASASNAAGTSTSHQPRHRMELASGHAGSHAAVSHAHAPRSSSVPRSPSPRLHTRDMGSLPAAGVGRSLSPEGAHTPPLVGMDLVQAVQADLARLPDRVMSHLRRGMGSETPECGVSQRNSAMLPSIGSGLLTSGTVTPHHGSQYCLVRMDQHVLSSNLGTPLALSPRPTGTMCVGPTSAGSLVSGPQLETAGSNATPFSGAHVVDGGTGFGAAGGSSDRGDPTLALLMAVQEDLAALPGRLVAVLGHANPAVADALQHAWSTASNVVVGVRGGPQDMDTAQFEDLDAGNVGQGGHSGAARPVTPGARHARTGSAASGLSTQASLRRLEGRVAPTPGIGTPLARQGSAAAAAHNMIGPVSAVRQLTADGRALSPPPATPYPSGLQRVGDSRSISTRASAPAGTSMHQEQARAPPPAGTAAAQEETAGPAATAAGATGSTAGKEAAGATELTDTAALIAAVQEDISRLPERLATIHGGAQGAHPLTWHASAVALAGMGNEASENGGLLTPMPSDKLLLKLDARITPSFTGAAGSSTTAGSSTRVRPGPAGAEALPTGTSPASRAASPPPSIPAASSAAMGLAPASSSSPASTGTTGFTALASQPSGFTGLTGGTSGTAKMSDGSGTAGTGYTTGCSDSSRSEAPTSPLGMEALLSLVQQDLAGLPDRLAGRGIAMSRMASASMPSTPLFSPRSSAQHAAPGSRYAHAGLQRLQARVIPSGAATPAYGARATGAGLSHGSSALLSSGTLNSLSGVVELPAENDVVHRQLVSLLQRVQQDGARLVERLEAAAAAAGRTQTDGCTDHILSSFDSQCLRRLPGRVMPSSELHGVSTSASHATLPAAAPTAAAAAGSVPATSGTAAAGQGVHLGAIDQQVLLQLLLQDLSGLPERLAAGGGNGNGGCASGSNAMLLHGRSSGAAGSHAPARKSSSGLAAWHRAAPEDGATGPLDSVRLLDSQRLLNRMDAQSFSSNVQLASAPSNASNVHLLESQRLFQRMDAQSFSSNATNVQPPDYKEKGLGAKLTAAMEQVTGQAWAGFEVPNNSQSGGSSTSSARPRRNARKTCEAGDGRSREATHVRAESFTSVSGGRPLSLLGRSMATGAAASCGAGVAGIRSAPAGDCSWAAHGVSPGVHAPAAGRTVSEDPEKMRAVADEAETELAHGMGHAGPMRSHASLMTAPALPAGHSAYGNSVDHRSGHKEVALFQLSGRARRLSGPSQLPSHGSTNASSGGGSAGCSSTSTSKGMQHAAGRASDAMQQPAGMVSGAGLDSIASVDDSSCNVLQRLSGRVLPSGQNVLLPPPLTAASRADLEAAAAAELAIAAAATARAKELKQLLRLDQERGRGGDEAAAAWLLQNSVAAAAAALERHRASYLPTEHAGLRQQNSGLSSADGHTYMPMWGWGNRGAGADGSTHAALMQIGGTSRTSLFSSEMNVNDAGYELGFDGPSRTATDATGAGALGQFGGTTIAPGAVPVMPQGMVLLQRLRSNASDAASDAPAALNVRGTGTDGRARVPTATAHGSAPQPTGTAAGTGEIAAAAGANAAATSAQAGAVTPHNVHAQLQDTDQDLELSQDYFSAAEGSQLPGSAGTGSQMATPQTSCPLEYPTHMGFLTPRTRSHMGLGTGSDGESSPSSCFLTPCGSPCGGQVCPSTPNRGTAEAAVVQPVGAAQPGEVVGAAPAVQSSGRAAQHATALVSKRSKSPLGSHAVSQEQVSSHNCEGSVSGMQSGSCESTGLALSRLSGRVMPSNLPLCQEPVYGHRALAADDASQVQHSTDMQQLSAGLVQLDHPSQSSLLSIPAPHTLSHSDTPSADSVEPSSDGMPPVVALDLDCHDEIRAVGPTSVPPDTGSARATAPPVPGVAVARTSIPHAAPHASGARAPMPRLSAAGSAAGSGATVDGEARGASRKRGSESGGPSIPAALIHAFGSSFEPSDPSSSLHLRIPTRMAAQQEAASDVDGGTDTPNTAHSGCGPWTFRRLSGRLTDSVSGCITVLPEVGGAQDPATFANGMGNGFTSTSALVAPTAQPLRLQKDSPTSASNAARALASSADGKTAGVEAGREVPDSDASCGAADGELSSSNHDGGSGDLRQAGSSGVENGLDPPQHSSTAGEVGSEPGLDFVTAHRGSGSSGQQTASLPAALTSADATNMSCAAMLQPAGSGLGSVSSGDGGGSADAAGPSPPPGGRSFTLELMHMLMGSSRASAVPRADVAPPSIPSTPKVNVVAAASAGHEASGAQAGAGSCVQDGGASRDAVLAAAPVRAATCGGVPSGVEHSLSGAQLLPRSLTALLHMCDGMEGGDGPLCARTSFSGTHSHSDGSPAGVQDTGRQCFSPAASESPVPGAEEAGSLACGVAPSGSGPQKQDAITGDHVTRHMLRAGDAVGSWAGARGSHA